MSASSQASGANSLLLTFTGSATLTLTLWVKVNAYSKTTFDVYFGLEAAPTPYRALACQQDADNDGTGSFAPGFWYQGSGGGYGSTGNMLTTAGIWTFCAISANGTTADFYWGIESGSLSTQQLTSIFSASLLTRAILGSDYYGDNANASYREVMLFSEARNATQILAQRDAYDTGPANSSGLISYLRCLSGTNPEVATSGSNWTRTGTFADDASNPNFPTPGQAGTLVSPTRQLLTGIMPHLRM